MTPTAVMERPRPEPPEASTGSRPRRGGGTLSDRRPTPRPPATEPAEAKGPAGPERFLFPIV